MKLTLCFATKLKIRVDLIYISLILATLCIPIWELLHLFLGRIELEISLEGKRKKIDLNWFLPRNYILFYISSFVRKKEWMKEKEENNWEVQTTKSTFALSTMSSTDEPSINYVFVIFWIMYSWPFLINWSPWLPQCFCTFD